MFEIGDCCFAGGKFCNRWCLKIEVAALGNGTTVSNAAQYYPIFISFLTDSSFFILLA